MRVPNLSEEELRSYLYSVCSESFEEMTELMSYIDTACLTCETLHCRELFDAIDIPCPPEMTYYGWNQPRKLLDSGYFYLYNGKKADNFWHIECPTPELLE